MKAIIIKFDIANHDIEIKCVGTGKKLKFQRYIHLKFNQYTKPNDWIECHPDIQDNSLLIIDTVYSPDEIHQHYNLNLLKGLVLCAGSISVITISSREYLYYYLTAIDSSLSIKLIKSISLILSIAGILLLIFSVFYFIAVLIAKVVYIGRSS